VEPGAWYFPRHARDFGFDPKAAIPALSDLLNDPDPEIRNGARQSLNQINSAGAVPKHF